MLPVHEIVVQLDDLRLETQHTALQGKPERGGCLSARRRAGDEDNLDLSPLLVNLVGDGGIIPLVKSLGEIDQAGSLAGEHGLVQCTNAVDPYDGAPIGVVHERGCYPGLLPDRNHLVEIIVRRELETEALAVWHKVKDLQISG